jgi:TPR repeat protein
VKAAELGVLEAQHNLAMNYIYGHVFPKDEVLGLAWLMKSSYNGFTISKFNLSKLLLYGS